MNLKKILNNKIVKNAGWLIFGRLANMLLSFIVSLLTARYLGPDNFGLINYATTYTTLFVSICNLGINSIIVKNLVDYPDEQGVTLGSTIIMKAISGFLSACMIFGIVSIIDYNEPVTIIVVALCSISLIFQSIETMNYWFQARLQSKYSAIATIVAYTIVSAYKFVLLATGQSVEWFAIANSIDYIVLAVVLIAVYKKKSGPKFSFSLKKCSQLLKSSYHFIITSIMVSIYASTDRIMLKQMLDESSVGYYSTAVTISNMWLFVLAAITDSMYPSIMQSFHESKEKFERENKKLYAIIFYLSIFVSLLFSILAPIAVQLLYGEAYMPAVNPLRIVTWYTAFSYLGVARNAWIVCYEKQKYLKYIYIGSAFINILLNFILIPLMQVSGAAIASLITQIATIVLPLFIKELRPNTKLIIDAVMLKGIFSKKQ